MDDRFGAVPPQVDDLFVTVRCRKLAVDLGFEKMSLKNNVLRCYFINRPILLILNQIFSIMSFNTCKQEPTKAG